MADKTNPLAEDEDFYIPEPVVKDIPVTPEQNEEDIKYFRKKLFAALKIPKELQGADDEPKQQDP